MSHIFGRDAAVAPPAAITWFSDWRTATGTTVAAIGDGGKWDSLNQIGALVSVVAAPADMPMPNALEIDYAGVGPVTARNVVRTPGAWPVPTAGRYLFRRLYFNNDRPVAGGATDHPVQAIDLTGPGCCAFAAELRFIAMGAGGTYGFEFATSGDGNPVPFDEFIHRWPTPTPLVKALSYRVEERFAKLAAANEYNYRALVYLESFSPTIPLYDWALGHFQCSQGAHGNPPPTPHNLVDATPPVIGMPTTCGGFPCIAKLMICQQGSGQGAGPAPITYGGAAVTETANPNGWCGPWTLAGG